LSEHQWANSSSPILRPSSGRCGAISDYDRASFSATRMTLTLTQTFPSSKCYNFSVSRSNRTTTNSGEIARYTKAPIRAALSLLPQMGLYFCYGECGGGDIIKLVSKIRQCDANEAARWIADGTGAVPQKPTIQGKVQRHPTRRRNFTRKATMRSPMRALRGST
jgi:hypothetical protein